MTNSKLFFSKDQDRYQELLEMVLLRDDLRIKIEGIRQKYSIIVSQSGYGDDIPMRQIIWLQEDEKLHDDVITILKELKISEGWLVPVVSYILDTLHKDEWVANDPEGVILQIDPIEKDKILLKLGPKATFSEIKKAWEVVKELRGKAPRNKQRNNHDRDIKILTMHKEGMSLAQICNAIKEEYGYTVKSNDKFDPGGFTQSYIRKIITEAYKRSNLNTPKLT